MPLAGYLLIIAVAGATYLLADALDAVDLAATRRTRGGEALNEQRPGIARHSHHDNGGR